MADHRQIISEAPVIPDLIISPGPGAIVVVTVVKMRDGHARCEWRGPSAPVEKSLVRELLEQAAKQL